MPYFEGEAKALNDTAMNQAGQILHPLLMPCPSWACRWILTLIWCGHVELCGWLLDYTHRSG